MKETLDWWTIIEQIISQSGKPFVERKLQKEVINELQKLYENMSSRVQPILVELPCGYGKTIIGETPFIAQLKTKNWITRGACYVLPTRALTKHHEDVIGKHLHLADTNVNIRAFHGEEHNTNLFYADFAVSTFDVFTYAYARSSRTGHHLEFPAGTIATSYVVFDEAHMLQDEYAYSHSIMNKILHVLNTSGVPTIIMTATMPKSIEDVVFDGLKPIKIPDIENSKDILKNEVYRGAIEDAMIVKGEPLKAVDWKKLQNELPNKRVLIICNTVLTAQRVFKEIKDKVSGINISGKVILLHSRLEKNERIRREKLVTALMGKVECAGNCGKDKLPLSLPLYLSQTNDDFKVFCKSCGSGKKDLKLIQYVIVIATQVVEAGLDISSDLLITECSPLDSLVQRAGRCARFPQQKGSLKVVYYDDVYRPYEKELVKRAYEILKGLSDKRMAVALTDFIESKSLIDDNYEVFKRKVLDKEELRTYLSYLEGFGFSTFTVDWRVLKEIRARPNAFLTLIVPDDKIKFLEAEKDADLRKGRFLRYKLVSDTKEMTYNEFLNQLSKLEEGKYIVLDCDFVSHHSFSIDYINATKQNKPKEFLLHAVDSDKNKLIGLELVRVLVNEEQGSYFYLVRIFPPEHKLLEGTYFVNTFFVNPEFYDKELGLKMGEES